MLAIYHLFADFVLSQTRLTQQAPRNQRALNLRRALDDARDPDVPVETLDGGALRIPCPTVDLKHAVDDAPGRLCGEELDHGTVAPPRAAAVWRNSARAAASSAAESASNHCTP